MRKKLKIQLSVADLFSAPTIESLAYKVSSMKILESSDITQNKPITLKKQKKVCSLEYFSLNSITRLFN